MTKAMARILFVCSRNQLRSPTAEAIYAKPAGIQVRSRGTNASARRRLSGADVAWADVIFVMEPEHKKRLLRDFRTKASRPRIVVLDIPDEYEFMDPDLVVLIRAGVDAELAKMAEIPSDEVRE